MRSVTRWAAFLLTVIGWGGAAFIFTTRTVGQTDPRIFLMCLTVGAVGLATLAAVHLVPEMARIYAAGYRHGLRDAGRVDDELTPRTGSLALVR